MILSLIVAMDRNRLIGANGQLPWHLPDDMAWFKKQTMGKPVIMGRRTWESIPMRFRPLPGRKNIVVSRNPNFRAEGGVVVTSPEDALAVAEGANEVMVIGGATLYRYFLPRAHRIYLTLVDGVFDGDTYFPPLDWAEWRIVSREDRLVDERHPVGFSWLVLARNGG